MIRHLFFIARSNSIALMCHDLYTVAVDERKQWNNVTGSRIRLMTEDTFQIVGAGNRPLTAFLAAKESKVLFGEQAEICFPLQVVPAGHRVSWISTSDQRPGEHGVNE